MIRILIMLTGLLFLTAVTLQNGKFPVGKWYVEEVVIPKGYVREDELETLKTLIAAYQASIFLFEQDGRAVFNFPITEMSITDGVWRYDPKTKTIIINDRNTTQPRPLMEIVVEKEKTGKTFFLVKGSPMHLYVIRK